LLCCKRREDTRVLHYRRDGRVAKGRGLENIRRRKSTVAHALLTEFKARTGCPVLINNSFNVRGEPIVCVPEDAFMGSDIEMLVVGNCILRKEDQNPALRLDYKDSFGAGSKDFKRAPDRTARRGSSAFQRETSGPEPERYAIGCLRRQAQDSNQRHREMVTSGAGGSTPA
jgi:hypothetical protein